MAKILVVEDENNIGEIVEINLKMAHHNVTRVTNAEDALTLINGGRKFDVAILDIMLPGTDGFEICREIRRHSICPIIFLTARGRQEDILYGYDLGCDDYIVKPFAMAELFAKVNAILKRAKGLVGVKQLTCGSISMNPATFEVKVDEQMIELPPKEFAILKYLMEHQNRVVEREVLLTRIWGYDYEGNERVVDNHVKKLRKALGDAGKQIKTVITKGYKLEGER